MAVGNDTVKTDLVKVRSLELQHPVNTSTVNPVGGLGNLLGGAVGTTEASLNELLAVLVEQVECLEVSAGGNLDQLCEAVADLRNWQGS